MTVSMSHPVKIEGFKKILTELSCKTLTCISLYLRTYSIIAIKHYDTSRFLIKHCTT